ncbi:hypothetical protein [Sphingomonas nostoxanthinifaciens]|uniref:hypothetical protein n=1 Tax=Sphingomonas nostoxanthinifaciens TaxID=2872652 RepID=UPI001CC1D95B|nr:hypothetical protein [Sphingomonas nostoxanthinifaciens]
MAQIDFALDEAADADPATTTGPEDQTPEPPLRATSRHGDVWLLGRHVLVCGDSREASHFDLLLGNERVDLVFTDPPYNVKIAGNVSGLGKVNIASSRWPLAR